MPKLMLVEDDNNLREIYEARLQAEGFTIVSAKDGEEALAVAKAEKPDLIISDVMMPKISGFEMLDILRNTDELKAVKVIMLTALGQSDDQQRANKLGADRYLVKSQVTLEDIVKVAHDLLEDQPPAAADPVATPAPVTAAEPVAAAPPEPAATTPPPAAPEPAAPVATEPAVTPPADPVATPTPASTDATATPIASEPAAPAATAPSEPITTAAPVATEPAVTPPADPVAPEPAAADPAATAAAEPVAETAPAAPEPAAEAIAPAIDPPEDASSSTVQPLAASAITTETEAEPTSKEEQDVDEQISNFVAGATTDASTPADPTAASETPAESTAAAQPEAPAAETDNSASNDKLVSDAVQSLLKETEDKDVPTPPPLPPSEAAKVQIKAASSATDGPSPDAGADTDAVDKPASDNNVTIAHKKVIAPPTQDAAKPDIQTLFELEQAKEAATTINNAPPQAVIADEKGKATEPLKTPPPAPEAGDPNSIAL